MIEKIPFGKNCRFGFPRFGWLTGGKRVGLWSILYWSYWSLINSAGKTQTRAPSQWVKMNPKAMSPRQGLLHGEWKRTQKQCHPDKGSFTVSENESKSNVTQTRAPSPWVKTNPKAMSPRQRAPSRWVKTNPKAMSPRQELLHGERKGTQKQCHPDKGSFTVSEKEPKSNVTQTRAPSQWAKMNPKAMSPRQRAPSRWAKMNPKAMSPRQGLLHGEQKWTRKQCYPDKGSFTVSENEPKSNVTQTRAPSWWAKMNSKTMSPRQGLLHGEQKWTQKQCHPDKGLLHGEQK